MADADEAMGTFAAALNTLLDKHVGRGAGRRGIAAFAADAGVGRTSLYDYRRGTTLPDEESLDRILDATAATRTQRLALVALREAAAAARSAAPEPETPSGSLPRRHHGFVTRSDELLRLDTHLAAVSQGGPGVVNIFGMPGVGKTALVLEWLHSRLAGFLETPVYLDLRGYSDEWHATRRDAAGLLLVALGVPRDEVPAVPADQVTALRRRTSTFRSVVVLDNAEDAQSVRHLIPSSERSLTVVVSRSLLPGLAVEPGASALEVPLLGVDDCVELLRKNSSAFTATPDEDLRQLARDSGRHPLALRLVAAQAATPSEDGATRRFVATQVLGDPRADMTRLVEGSLTRLAEPVRTAFHRIVALPAVTITPGLLATCCATTPEDAAGLLTALAGVGLLEPLARDVYEMHGLVRLAAPDAGGEVGAAVEVETLTRCLATLSAASADPTRGPEESWAAAVLNRAATIVPVAAYGPSVTWGQRFHDQGRFESAESCATAALTAARSIGHHVHEAQALLLRGRALERMARLDEAGADTRAALTMLDGQESVADRVAGLTAIGRICMATGDHDQALAALEQASSLTDPDLAPGAAARILVNTGIVHERRGDHERALVAYEAALAHAVTASDDRLVATALSNMGTAQERLGRLLQAHETHRQALVAARRLGDRFIEGVTLGNLGVLAEAMCDYEGAIRHARAARAIAVDIKDELGAASTFVNEAESLRALGRYPEAERAAREGVRRTTELGVPEWEIQALTALALVRLARGDEAETGQLLSEAKALCVATDDGALLAKVLNASGRLATVRRQLDVAAGLLSQARDLALQHGQVFYEAEAWLALADCALAGRNLAEASHSWLEAAGAFERAGATRRADQARSRAGTRASRR